MAGKEVGSEGGNIAGMSKNQLYDIMSQMKKLMEQNEKQAKQILVQNPTLARDLFQAQILLGMVQPTQTMGTPSPTIQSTQTLPSHVQQSNTHSVPAVSSGQMNLQDQMRKPHQMQPPLLVTPVTAPPSNLQPPSLPPHPLHPAQQPKSHVSALSASVSLPPHPNMPPLPHLQPHMSSVPTQLDQSIQSGGMQQHLPTLQPPLPPPQVRPPVQSFSQQIHPQIGPNAGFQQAGPPPQIHHSQPMFHGGKPPGPMGSSFIMPGQPPPQTLYQGGGSHIRTDFNHIGSSMPMDRGANSAWIPGLLPDNNTPKAQLPGPPPPFPGQMGTGNQSARQSALTPEMEHALLQQVMSLTPEQIHLLPPDQRNQVLQLQQMLRK
ncbi:unnamed protein product [Cuscuta epithymum]|uniref:Uncharacterized protein n=2 Tax=Cuscuta epithymum TaxID=186058 RepID=A0AAV0G8R9_9ASTE|nr:unnamed protein product [Cuscuta epithymum]